MNFLNKHERLVLLCLAGAIFCGSLIRYTVSISPHLKDYINTLESPRIYPKVDLNRADIERLKSVPMIGDYRARQIIAYREKVSSFQRIEDLKMVRGISAATFEKVKNYFKVARDK